MQTKAFLWLAFALLSVALSGGCDREEVISEYDAPKDQPPPTSVATSAPATAPAAAPDSVAGLAWSVPSGWVAQPPQQMRSVWFRASTDAGETEVIISKLGGAYGSLRANIDRWRGMADLPPLDPAAELPKAVQTQIDGAESSVYDFAGTGEKAKRVRVVILPAPGGELTYFFRLQGPAAAVARQQATFDGFVQSVRFKK